ncbi:Pal1-domain-containing protein [Corynespora cassiicola Philippines]|uniref:Pal1-domain-containing protein n=1 Tax=Corynespora cassiicola Philippines TaxID=1448308 RepID=A0A2T2NS37_CORCC|nr:Pal1-domain-containing protein [Corynespora cassiicola Philippines]
MIAEPSMPERRPSPGLSLNLSSNNPFRNRAGSPAAPSPALQTPSSAGSRPMSRNPFLSTFEAEFNKQAQLIDMSATMKESPKKTTFGNTAEELFNNLTLDEGASKRRPAPRDPHQRTGTAPLAGHRPSRSDEEERARRDRDRDAYRDRERERERERERDRERDRDRDGPRGPPRSRGPPGSRPTHRSSPERRENRRPRRNSESSMIDKGSLDPNEERRRRERRKERDDKTRDGKSRRVRKPQGLDIIDKLDVSGIYGPSMIHHDGPYDAVQPHRNRKKDVRAPMQAFPVGSANNVLGGAGPLNDSIDLDKFHGRGAEGFTDFGGTDGGFKKRPELEGRAVSFNPKERMDIIHGDESVGLGTSTFLEGTPASRTAIQKESDDKRAADLGGLGRKKSIAQRIRGISQPRRGYGEGGPRITSPEARYGSGQSPNSPYSGGGLATTKSNEQNPFFDEYDAAYERKGAAIRTAETDGKDGPVRSPSSPGGRNPLNRSATADGLTSPAEPKPNAPSGFLGRMKSLKGGRRPRPERPA